MTDLPDRAFPYATLRPAPARASKKEAQPCGACGERRGHLYQCPAVVPLDGLTAAQLLTILEPPTSGATS